MKEALWLDVEKRFVAHWLEKSKGVVTAAAKGAGVNRCQFHQLIAKTGLDPDRFR
jgi:DNA-binding NtrC family response regulator